MAGCIKHRWSIKHSLNDGDAIAEWKDLSGNDNDAVQENDALPDHVDF